MKAMILFATALVALPTWAYGTTPGALDSSVLTGVKACNSDDGPFTSYATLWETPMDPFWKPTPHSPRQRAGRVFHLLRNYTRSRVLEEFSLKDRPRIEFIKTPDLQYGKLLGHDMTISNYTLSLDVYIKTHMEGVYTFDFRAADAGLVQLGRCIYTCQKHLGWFVRKEVRFQTIHPDFSASRKIYLEKNSVYPMRILLTNMFYGSGMELVIKGPDGNELEWPMNDG